MNTVNETSSSNKTNVKAITSMVLGILCIVFIITVGLLGIAMAIIGLIFGILGLKEIKQSGQTGRGMAIAGLICSAVGLVIPVLILIIFFNMSVG